MAPCPELIWLAAAVPCIPMESVRYNPLRRKQCVITWMKNGKAFEITDGVFRKTDRPAKSKAKVAGHLFWAKLQETKRLSEAETQSSWSHSTWIGYSRTLLRFGWCRKSDDGSLLWIGPENITFVEFQQRRSAEYSQ